MGNSGDKNHNNFHNHFSQFQHHHHHHDNKELKVIPKGYLAILVGHEEELQRFVIPVIYLKHPLFIDLLKEAEEEYGFNQEGPITIPCHVEEFRNVQGLIEARDNDHLHHNVLCFRA